MIFTPQRSVPFLSVAPARSLTVSDLYGEPILDTRARVDVGGGEVRAHRPRGTALVPRSVALSYSRPDLVTVSLTDAASVETCVVVPEDRREQRVQDLVTVAVDMLPEVPARFTAVD